MIGIENINEFYTHHYLDAILGRDVRPHLERWRTPDSDPSDPDADATPDAGATPDANNAADPTAAAPNAAPWRRLATLQQTYFRLREERRSPTLHLLDALGYTPRPHLHPLPDVDLPLLAAWNRADGEPLLWLLEGHGTDDLLLRTLRTPEHLPDAASAPRVTQLRVTQRPETQHDAAPLTLEEAANAAFSAEDAPRFLLLLGDDAWILADRDKWPEQRLLRFDWDELLGRRDPRTLEVLTALLHRETLAPEQGTSLRAIA